MSFSNFGLSDKIIQGIEATGYTTPTKIQTQAIPIILEGSDLIGCAQTGTGKTAAFVLPMLQRLTPEVKNRTAIRGLVITPTRELAVQIEEAIKSCGRFTKLRSTTIYGGVGMEPQYRALYRGVDIVVATPGRLLDHINRRSIDLSMLEILILDEADRMLDMGFINDIRKITGLLPKERQTLLFSATMSEGIRSLANTLLRNPKSIEVGQRRNPAEGVTQRVFPVHQEMKMDLLLHILSNEADMNSVLIFSRTKHGADKIALKLERKGIRATAIHSNRSQSQRLRALQGFKRGDFRVMVATDIAARGIDVDGISHVINFDIPGSPEDYIHRIGRTGRASLTGDALTFISRGEEGALRRTEQYMGKRLQREEYPGFDYSRRAAVESMGESDSYRERSYSSERSGGYSSDRSGGSSYSREQRPVGRASGAVKTGAVKTPVMKNRSRRNWNS